MQVSEGFTLTDAMICDFGTNYSKSCTVYSVDMITIRHTKTTKRVMTVKINFFKTAESQGNA